MPAGVVPDGGLLVLRQDVDPGREHRFDRPVGPLGAGQGGVRIVDICLVMRVVVDLHRLRIDVRFESVVRVWKIGQFEGHSAAPFATLRVVAEDMLPPLSSA